MPTGTPAPFNECAPIMLTERPPKVLQLLVPIVCS